MGDRDLDRIAQRIMEALRKSQPERFEKIDGGTPAGTGGARHARDPAALAVVDVGLGLHDHLVPRSRLREEAEEVPHRPARHQEPRLHPDELRRERLQLLGLPALAGQVGVHVAERRQRVDHLGGRLGERVGPELDERALCRHHAAQAIGHRRESRQGERRAHPGKEHRIGTETDRGSRARFSAAPSPSARRRARG